ncbi:MAG: hypothetical protein AB4062_01230 [Crocosphaera sp.]
MLQKIGEVLATHWLTILSIIFGIVGVLGTIVGYLSWRSGNKTQKAYEYLFKLAEKNIEKDNLDQGINQRKVQLQETLSKVSELQSKIEKDIPLKARRTVLLDKFNTQVEYLNEIYLSIQAIRNELESLGEPVTLPNELIKAIENEINPAYIRKRRSDEYRNYLTLITGGSTIASVLLPYPFSQWIIWIIMVPFGLPVILQLIKYSIPLDPSSRRRIIFRMFFFTLLSFGSAGIISGTIWIIISLLYPNNMNFTPGLFILVIGLLLFIISFLYRSFQNLTYTVKKRR